MGDWVVKQSDDNCLTTLLTGGLTLFLSGKSTYEVENEEIGEIRRVTAKDADELSEKIETGDFDDE